MPRIRIKVCCISSPEEASMAIDAGADALGLVSAMPSGPGVIEDDEIARIAARVPPPISTFLLTSAIDADQIIEQHRLCRTRALQLVDRVAAAAHRALRRALPGIALVQVIHVVDECAIDEAMESAENVDALLLDSGNPGLSVKELGGTGRIHNWEISRQIVEKVSTPVFLAGGLRPENARAAVDRVRPFGLDVCSGVRTGGALDPQKLASFIQAAGA